MDYMELFKKRYSCKKYDSAKPVEREKLTRILTAGQVAPTAKNSQPQRVYVLESEAALAGVDALTPCRYGAPTVLAVTFRHGEDFTYPGGEYHSGAEDAAIVATHMMLAAAAEGLDSCWLNNFNPKRASETIGTPEKETLVLLLDLGYAKEGTKPLPNHEKTKPLEELVKYL